MRSLLYLTGRTPFPFPFPTEPGQLDSVGSENVSTDNELLATIDSQLDPGAGAFSRLIEARLTLRHNDFESLLANDRNHVIGRNIEMFRDANWRTRLEN